MSKLKKRSQYEAEAAIEALSPTRRRLHDLNEERRVLSEQMADLGAQSAKLGAVVEAVGPARHRLAAFDGAHKDALTRWARGAEPVMPRADAARRAELVAAIADAEASAEAAKAAQAELATEIDAAGRRGNALQSEAEKIAKVILVESMRELMPQIEAARAENDRLAQQLADCRSEVLRGIGYGVKGFEEPLSALEHFERDRHLAEQPAPVAPNGEAWRRYSGALMTDATVSFADAQSFELPTLRPAPRALDPIVAMDRAVASFPSNSIGSW